MVKMSHDAQCVQIRRDLEDLNDRAMKYKLEQWEIKSELEKYIVKSRYARCIQQYARGYYDAMVSRCETCERR